MKSKAAVMEGIGKMGIRELDIPEPGEGEVLVRNHKCNICTTDWQTWAGLRKSQGRKFPWAPGHEMGSEIVAVGKGVNKELKIGDHVGFGYGFCGECYWCRRGDTSKCTGEGTSYSYNGLTGSFGMSQYMLVPSKMVYKVSLELPWEEAGYLEPLGTAIRGVRRLRVKPGENILVIGAGNLGLVNAQAARAFGGRVMVSEINEERCGIAESLGFETVNPKKADVAAWCKEKTDGRGVDGVILAVGNTAANQQALEAVGVTGRILFFAAGYPAPEIEVDPNTIHYTEIELIGTYGGDLRDWQLAADFLSRGIVKTDKLVSHQVPLDEVQHAFELAATPGNYRVSLVLWP
ncbi:MAG TPA: alcohol dehydrogenase catalytic domain-containing protein [Firmicutes bacterium]|nr:alcohol dehydrogenase catalytic domain-containing protein [Candidatus Fermentithermobacillaceae bacterium]